MTHSGRAGWVGVCALLGALALLGGAVDRQAIDWQPALAARQPWRAWTAVGVHYSALHLAANLAGATLVAALGWAANVAPRSVAAWLIAWPLTHFALAIEPALIHYGGLSGVLHAGVAVVAVELVRRATPAQRRIGWALLAGLALKLATETPWGAPLRYPAGWDIAIAPLAHASGTAAGLLGALASQWLSHRLRTGSP